MARTERSQRIYQVFKLINCEVEFRRHQINSDDLRLFKLCKTLHFLTHGLFDPTTLPISNIWDFKPKNPKIPNESNIKEAITKVGWEKVILEEISHVFLYKENENLIFMNNQSFEQLNVNIDSLKNKILYNQDNEI